MECNFLNEFFNIEEQITGILNVSIFIMGMIDNSGLYRDGKFHGGEIVLLDKVSVNARDICTAINQCLGVNDFH